MESVGSSSAVTPSETLCRFIFDSGQFSTVLVKHRAFLPAFNKDISPPRLETSVHRINGMGEEQIRMAGVAAGLNRGKEPRAQGHVSARVVLEQNLAVDAAEPPLKHAVIVGWPGGKDDQMDLAKEIARQAILRRPPD